MYYNDINSCTLYSHTIYYTHALYILIHSYIRCLGQLKENKRRGRLQLEGRKNVEETKVGMSVYEYIVCRCILLFIHMFL